MATPVRNKAADVFESVLERGVPLQVILVIAAVALALGVAIGFFAGNVGEGPAAGLSSLHNGIPATSADAVQGGR
jgi:hypothetical protein